MNAADVNAGITYLNLPFRSSTYHDKREDDRFTLMTIREKKYLLVDVGLLLLLGESEVE